MCSKVLRLKLVTDVGPQMYVVAAQHFYRALKVYPQTAELLDIYKKTVPDVNFLSNELI